MVFENKLVNFKDKIRCLLKKGQVVSYRFYDYSSELDLIYAYDKVGVFPVFNVLINNCRNPFGFDYGMNSNHYFVRQLSGFCDDEVYDKSYLCRFWQQWHPMTIGEVFGFDNKSVSGEYLNQKLINGFMLPWQCRYSISNSAAGWQYSGPVSYDMGLEHFKRLKSVYSSVVRFGYRPEESLNNFDVHMKGYFLKRNDEFRFLIVNGTHRMAVLSFLYKNQKYKDFVPVTFRMNSPRVIDVANVLEWPQVRNGNISSSDAKIVFDKIFDGNNVDI